MSTDGRRNSGLLVFVSNVLIDYWEKRTYTIYAMKCCQAAAVGAPKALNFMVLSEDGMSIYIGSMRCSRKI